MGPGNQQAELPGALTGAPLNAEQGPILLPGREKTYFHPAVFCQDTYAAWGRTWLTAFT